MKNNSVKMWIDADLVGFTIPLILEQAISEGVSDEASDTYKAYCGSNVKDLERNANLRYTFLIGRATAIYIQICIDSSIERRSFPRLRKWLLGKIIGF